MVLRRSCCAFLFAAGVIAHAESSPLLSVHFFDVGEGSSALIVSPSGKTILVDGGPPGAGGAVAQRLKELSRGSLDLMVLSHPHQDHIGGLADAAAAGGVRVFLEPAFRHPSPAYESLLAALARQGVERRVGETGDRFDAGGGASVQVVWPRRTLLTGTRSDLAANSLVTRVVFGRTSFLFAGDIGPEAEAALASSERDLSASVLAVANHGDARSSTEAFLSSVKPDIAVVSCGPGNDRGHPSRAALDRLEASGARVLRTDLDGEITVQSDGSKLSVSVGNATSALAANVESVPPASPSKALPDRRRGSKQGDGRLPRPRASGVSTEASSYVGSINSQVFHRSDCDVAAHIRTENLVRWPARDQAVATGRRPAGCCRP